NCKLQPVRARNAKAPVQRRRQLPRAKKAKALVQRRNRALRKRRQLQAGQAATDQTIAPADQEAV
ncbi:hypothetical protein LTR28_012814, partial [Elasticomyces elasticus]